MSGIATSADVVSDIMKKRDSIIYESAPLKVACNAKNDHADGRASINRSGSLQASEKVVSNR